MRARKPSAGAARRAALVSTRPPAPPRLLLPRHRFFNTNNLWLHLPKLKAAMEAAGGALALPLIKNKKTVNPRDASSPAVYQLETAMGAAVALFPDAGAVVVPRTRFAPVKTTGDLLLVRSDAYAVAGDATLAPVKPPPAAVALDSCYKLVDQLDALIPSPPSLVGCTSLRVRGAVRFAPGVVLEGDVLVANDSGGKEPVELVRGSYRDSVIALPPDAAAAPADGVPASATA